MNKRKENDALGFDAVEKKIGYCFKDKSLLIQAFTRTSFCNEHGKEYQSNEVLEFFGDSVLSAAIITFLVQNCSERYRHGIKTGLTEGDFSNIKSKLSDKKNLSECTLALGLQKHLRMGEGDVKLGIANEPSVMEDLFESIVGAVYIDSGLDMPTVMRVVAGMLDMHSYTLNTPPIQSSKNALQEWCADKKRRLPQPRYETLSEDGPDHKKTYVRGCYVGERLVGRGVGKNLKIADAAAAEDALRLLTGESVTSDSETVKLPTAPAEHKGSNSMKNAANKSANKDAKNLSTPSHKAPKKAKCVPNRSKSAVTAAAKEEILPTRIETTESIQSAKRQASSAATLKSYASSNKTATPSFKDLGQTVGKGGKTEYKIECRFMGECAIGIGEDRISAREMAASAIKTKLAIGVKKAKPHPRVKKNTSRKRIT